VVCPESVGPTMEKIEDPKRAVPVMEDGSPGSSAESCRLPVRTEHCTRTTTVSITGGAQNGTSGVLAKTDSPAAGTGRSAGDGNKLEPSFGVCRGYSLVGGQGKYSKVTRSDGSQDVRQLAIGRRGRSLTLTSTSQPRT